MEINKPVKLKNYMLYQYPGIPFTFKDIGTGIALKASAGDFLTDKGTVGSGAYINNGGSYELNMDKTVCWRPVNKKYIEAVAPLKDLEGERKAFYWDAEIQITERGRDNPGYRIVIKLGEDDNYSAELKRVEG